MGQHLVLWDIDKTLVDLSGLGGRWYGVALREVTGIELRAEPSFAGHTERAISSAVLRGHGVEPTEQLITAMFDSLTAIVARNTAELSAVGRVLPGAREALAALEAMDSAVQTLVTGNLRDVAEYKLAAFDLHGYLDLSLGGYGELSMLRADQVAAAMGNSVRRHGEPDSVTVLGDTPDDITAARAHGATAIGVTTGGFGHAELAAAGADHVLPGLQDTDHVLSVILG